MWGLNENHRTYFLVTRNLAECVRACVLYAKDLNLRPLDAPDTERTYLLACVGLPAPRIDLTPEQQMRMHIRLARWDQQRVMTKICGALQ